MCCAAAIKSHTAFEQFGHGRELEIKGEGRKGQVRNAEKSASDIAMFFGKNLSRCLLSFPCTGHH